jgi:hypothetical protein
LLFLGLRYWGGVTSRPWRFGGNVFPYFEVFTPEKLGQLLFVVGGGIGQKV